MAPINENLHHGGLDPSMITSATTSKELDRKTFRSSFESLVNNAAEGVILLIPSKKARVAIAGGVLALALPFSATPVGAESADCPAGSSPQTIVPGDSWYDLSQTYGASPLRDANQSRYGSDQSPSGDGLYEGSTLIIGRTFCAPGGSRDSGNGGDSGGPDSGSSSGCTWDQGGQVRFVDREGDPVSMGTDEVEDVRFRVDRGITCVRPDVISSQGAGTISVTGVEPHSSEPFNSCTVIPVGNLYEIRWKTGLLLNGPCDIDVNFSSNASPATVIFEVGQDTFTIKSEADPDGGILDTIGDAIGSVGEAVGRLFETETRTDVEVIGDDTRIIDPPGITRPVPLSPEELKRGDQRFGPR